MDYRTEILKDKIDRSWVKYPLDEVRGRIERLSNPEGGKPEISIVIPTIDKTRDGYLPALLEQIGRQEYKNYEIILIIGDNRQGRAINAGVSVAKGDYIVIFDDDTKLGSDDLLQKMVDAMKSNPDIGMAGVANIVPDDAGWFVRRVMKELPRRTSPIVHEITDSDLAEHPCCIIPKKVFMEIGGENELIPRGLDPYLRREIRKAGYRVVVLPELFIHHLPPASFAKFVKQIFRNGKMAAYVNKFYPEFVVELTTEHGKEVREKRTIVVRIISYFFRIVKSIILLRFLYLSSLVFYLAGYVYGWIVIKDKNM